MSAALQQLQHANIINALAEQGWCVLNDYFSADLVEALATEAEQLFQQQRMQPAGIGRGTQLQQNQTIRQDQIYWLTGESPAQAAYLQHMEALRIAINRALFLGLFELEAHFAVYPAGAFYKLHRDSFQGAANRVVSVVSYLNTAWPEDAGGELCIYAADQATLLAREQPKAGKLVVFLSEEIPHAVLPAQQQRLSIAGWFRVQQGNFS